MSLLWKKGGKTCGKKRWRGGTRRRMKKYSLLPIFILVLTMTFISSNTQTQQVIFTEINLTLTIQNNTLKYSLNQEGVYAERTFNLDIINNSINIFNNTDEIKINFLRTIDRNETDIDIILRAIANSNATELYFNCSSQLSECLHDIQYESNYTICSSSLGFCEQSLAVSQDQVTKSNEIISSLKTHRIILLLLLLSAGFFVYKFYSQTVIKQAKTNFRGMMGSSRIQ
jgi:hypothetical protein